MKNLPAILSIVSALACVTSARADLTMTLSSSVQNSARGKEIVFSGTLANSSATDKIFLNDIVATLNGASATNLALQPNTFFSNVPGILLPGESYTNGELFGVSLGSAAPAGDYGGTITVRGGANIFANSDLASAPFGVLSPAVSIVATDPSASEFGPDSGVFTISRAGGTEIDLPVSFAISGTAVNGSAYSVLSSPITIGAGNSAVTLTIAPIPNNIAEGDRTAIFTLNPSAAYNLDTISSDTVTIHDKPADEWRFQNFGANANDPLAADNSDWDGDGIQNLVEFALNLDPKNANASALPAPVIIDGYLTLSYVPNPAASDVSYAVESTTNLADLTSWNSVDVEPADPNPPGSLTFRYKYPVNLATQAFLRLHVVRTDP